MANPIQQVILKYIQAYPITPSPLQTKQWRQGCEWYDTGKRNECELYQRATVESITGHTCSKSDCRLNIISKDMVEKKYPMKDIDGFEWTEDFDGFIPYNKTHLYFNFKMICDAGGVQTRSLREVYHFISIQLDHLIIQREKKRNNGTDDSLSLPTFVNILDGDTSFKHMEKFHHLINKERYVDIRNNVFVGDMHQFKQDFWANIEPAI